ncbi:MAG: pilus assembly protein PilP [Bradymonadia bacterium]|jgi:Tfp pilus assembly protein PilP
MRKRVFRKAALVSLLCMAMGSSYGCEEEYSVPVSTVQTASQTKARQGSLNKQALELAEGNWQPAKNWERQNYQRNPFRGFIDAIMAERINEINRKAMDEEGGGESITLPAQMYSVKDYKLIAVITGTADPKAFVLDPSGNRFVLRRGDLVGNNNGTVSNIQRDKIEVFEMISGEGKYIEMLLYPEEKKGINLSIR